MKDLSIKVVVTGPASPASPAGFFYREEHEWRGMTNTGQYFEKLLAETFELANKLAAKKDGDLTATFEATADGVVYPVNTVSGFTREAMTKFERHVNKKQGELLAIGEKQAKKKT